MAIRSTDSDFAVYLDAYPFDAPWKAVKEESGMNNTTRIVYTGNEKYVLRVYDNHRNTAIVRIEHRLLDKLQEANLPFRVPRPVYNRSGSTITSTLDGKLAALYHYIDGERPTADTDRHVEGLGAAAGALSYAMSALEVGEDIEPIYKPYYEFEQSHAAMTEEIIGRMSASSELLGRRQTELKQLLIERTRLAGLRAAFASMPHQWIHGDIVFNNALVQKDRVSGILDFEFCTIDLRAMELAVVLAEFPSEDFSKAMKQIALFCRGYGASAKLTKEEINLLPDLVKLRMLDVFLHFAGRHSEGLDSEQVWDEQIRRAAYVCGWINLHHNELIALFDNYLR